MSSDFVVKLSELGGRVVQVRVSYGETINLGNYESRRVDAAYTVDVSEDGDPTKIQHFLYGMGKAFVQASKDYESRVEKLLSALSPYRTDSVVLEAQRLSIEVDEYLLSDDRAMLLAKADEAITDAKKSERDRRVKQAKDLLILRRAIEDARTWSAPAGSEEAEEEEYTESPWGVRLRELLKGLTGEYAYRNHHLRLSQEEWAAATAEELYLRVNSNAKLEPLLDGDDFGPDEIPF